MKCDKLKPVLVDTSGNIVANERGELYYKPEVDTAIDELKTEHHRERHEYIEMAAMLRRENRRLKRALWLSRADRAHKEVILFRDFSCLVGKEFKWRKIEKLCRAKAEEYK